MEHPPNQQVLNPNLYMQGTLALVSVTDSKERAHRLSEPDPLFVLWSSFMSGNEDSHRLHFAKIFITIVTFLH